MPRCKLASWERNPAASCLLKNCRPSLCTLYLYPLTTVFTQVTGGVSWWVISRLTQTSKTTLTTCYLLVETSIFTLDDHKPSCSTIIYPQTELFSPSLTFNQAQQGQLPPNQWDLNICTSPTVSSSLLIRHHGFTNKAHAAKWIFLLLHFKTSCG